MQTETENDTMDLIMSNHWIKPKAITKESAKSYGDCEPLKKLDYQMAYDESVQKINHAIRMNYDLLEKGESITSQPIVSCVNFSAIFDDVEKAFSKEGFDIDVANNSTMFAITLKR